MTALADHSRPFPGAAWAPLWAVLIWSGNTVATKASAGLIDPASIAFYRWLLAFAVLTPFMGAAVWRKRAVILQHWWKIAILGALGMATFQSLAYIAARTTTAVNMGVEMAMMPLFAALLSNAVSGESVPLRRWAGAVLSLGGLVILTTQGHPSTLISGGVHEGDLWMLTAVFSNAVYGALLKRWPMPLTTWQQLYPQIFFGVLVLMPFWLSGPMTPINAANAVLILYAGIPASIGSPFFWMTGVKAIGAPRAALFMNLLPLFVAVEAWVLLDEQLHVYHAIGAAVALSGVVLGLWQRPQRATSSATTI